MLDVIKPKLTVETLSDWQKEAFNECIANIQNIFEQHVQFRMEVAEQVVLLKNKIFSSGFDPGGYEERFVIIGVAKEIGMAVGTIASWVKVYLTIDADKENLGSDYDELSYSEKLQISTEIRNKKKRATTAVKEHLANRNDPVKKKVYYLERYAGQTLNTFRSIEELKPVLSDSQTKLFSELKVKMLLTIEIIDRLVAK